MSFGFWIDTPDGLSQEREAPNQEELPLSATEGDVHASPVSEKAECPSSRHGVVSNERQNDDVGLAALKRVHCSDKRSVALS